MSFLWEVAKAVARKVEPLAKRAWDAYEERWNYQQATPEARAAIRAMQSREAIAAQRFTRAKKRWERMDVAERIQWTGALSVLWYAQEELFASSWDELMPPERDALMKLELDA